jgi:hypothetical protein
MAKTLVEILADVLFGESSLQLQEDVVGVSGGNDVAGHERLHGQPEGFPGLILAIPPL